MAIVMEFISKALEFSKQHYIYIAISLIILTFLYWYIRYDLVTLMSIKKSLRRAYIGIDAINGCEIENVNKINRVFDGMVSPSIKRIWNDYHYDFKTVSKRKSCPDARDFFDIDSVITIPASRKKVEAVPGIITALGVLGTFAGLAIGISGFKISGDIASGNFDALFMAASLALISSIAAIAFSLIFQVLDRQMYHGAVKELYTFYSVIERKIPVLNEKSGFGMLVSSQEELGESMRKALKDMSGNFDISSISKLVSDISESYKESIEKFIAPYFEKMGGMIKSISDEALKTQGDGAQKIAELFTERFNAAMEGQFKLFGSNIDKLSKSLDMTIEKMESTLQGMARSIKEQKEINDYSNSIAKNMSEHNRLIIDAEKKWVFNLDKVGQFVDSTSQLLETHKGLAESLTEQNTELHKENREYFSNMNLQIQKLQDDLNFGIEGVMTRFTEIMQTSLDRIEKGMGSAMESMDGNIRTMLETMDEQVRNISLYASELNTNMGDLNERLESSVGDFSEQLNMGIRNTFESFDEGLAEISKRLSAVISEVRDSIEDLPKVIGELKDDISVRRDK